jgi:hypothetical protein
LPSIRGKASFSLFVPQVSPPPRVTLSHVGPASTNQGADPRKEARHLRVLYFPSTRSHFGRCKNHHAVHRRLPCLCPSVVRAHQRNVHRKTRLRLRKKLTGHFQATSVPISKAWRPLLNFRQEKRLGWCVSTSIELPQWCAPSAPVPRLLTLAVVAPPGPHGSQSQISSR